MKPSKKILMLAAMPLLACALSMEARAEQVTVTFRAQVTGVEDLWGVIAGRIKVGDVIDGIYVYDTEIPDIYPLPTSGLYVTKAQHHGISMLVNNFVFSSNPANPVLAVETRDGISNQQKDLLRLLSTKNLFELTVPDQVYNDISLLLEDDSGSVLQSDALPVSAPTLSQWTSAQVGIFSMSGGAAKFLINAVVTDIVDCRITGTNGKTCR